MRASLTPPAERAVLTARAIASELDPPEARPEHLLIGLMSSRGSFAQEALTRANVKASNVLGAPTSVVTTMIVLSEDERDLPAAHLSAETTAILQHATLLADDMGHAFVGTEHLLLAILEAGETGMQTYLRAHGLAAETIRAQLLGEG